MRLRWAVLRVLDPEPAGYLLQRLRDADRPPVEVEVAPGEAERLAGAGAGVQHEDEQRAEAVGPAGRGERGGLIRGHHLDLGPWLPRLADAGGGVRRQLAVADRGVQCRHQRGAGLADHLRGDPVGQEARVQGLDVGPPEPGQLQPAEPGARGTSRRGGSRGRASRARRGRRSHSASGSASPRPSGSRRRAGCQCRPGAAVPGASVWASAFVSPYTGFRRRLPVAVNPRLTDPDPQPVTPLVDGALAPAPSLPCHASPLLFSQTLLLLTPLLLRLLPLVLQCFRVLLLVLEVSTPLAQFAGDGLPLRVGGSSFPQSPQTGGVNWPLTSDRNTSCQ